MLYTKQLLVKSCDTGLGVFTTVQIPANVPIMEMTGDLHIGPDVPWDPTAYLQIAGDRYIGPSGSTDDYINHSCDPNCSVHIVGNRVILYSLYVIPKGFELTFDYSTTSTDSKDSWKMECKCGSSKCRGTVSGWQYLSKDLQEEYQKKGMVPLYLTMPSLFMKR